LFGTKCRHVGSRTIVRHNIWKRFDKFGMTGVAMRKRFTLMPAISLAALSLMVTVPALSSMHLYAATAQRYAVVTVQPGDTLWSIAAAHTNSNADVQETIDRISATNHLQASSILPGERLRVPE
jgi:predicted Zn-dependent protease